MGEEVKRDEKGRWLPGTKPGPGNPLAKKVSQVRKAFLEAATPERIQKVVETLMKEAMDGNLLAAELVLDRIFGKGRALVERTPEVQRSPEETVSTLLKTIKKRIQMGTPAPPE